MVEVNFSTCNLVKPGYPWVVTSELMNKLSVFINYDGPGICWQYVKDVLSLGCGSVVQTPSLKKWRT